MVYPRNASFRSTLFAACATLLGGCSDRPAAEDGAENSDRLATIQQMYE